MKLKGKTIIELTNVNTGEVEHYEDENIVTNVFQKMFESIGRFTSTTLLTNQKILPYHNHLLGGVLLFDKTIDENKDTIYAPAGTNLIACGVYQKQNDTVGTCRGNYNQDESEENVESGTIKYVYDFPTSKGNGTINCVCLTSSLGGYSSYGSDDATIANSSVSTNEMMSYFISQNINTWKTSPNEIRQDSTYGTNNEYPFMMDIDNDVFYLLRVDSKKSITILQRKAFCKSVSLFDTPLGGGNIVSTKTFSDLTTGLYDIEYHSNIAINVDTKNNKLYIATSENKNYTDASKHIYIQEITLDDDLQSMTIQEKTILNQVGETLQFGRVKSFIYDGYLYIHNNKSPYYIYKININNDSDYTKIVMPTNSGNEYIYLSNPMYVLNDRIYCGPYYNTAMYFETRSYLSYIIDTKNNTALPTESKFFIYPASLILPVKNRPWMYRLTYTYSVSDVADGFWFISNYLATINNLAQPITKTAEKTMKLTYILQKAESE